MITTSPEWDIASQMPGAVWFAARLYYGDQTKYFSVGSKDFVLDDEKFFGMIINKPAIKGGFDFQTRDWQINSGMIELTNHIDWVTTFGKLASTLGSGDDIGFENRRVELRLIKDGISKFENGYPLLESGRMYRPEYGSGKVVIKIEDDSGNLFGTLGEVITQADARSGYTLPIKSIGRIKPIIYGDHRNYIGATVNNSLAISQWKANANPRLVPAIDLGGGYYMIESHGVAGTPAKDDGDNLWIVNSQTGRWADLLDPYNVISNDETGAILQPIPDFIASALFFTEYDLAIEVENLGGSNFTNPENAIDGDVDTDATITLTVVNDTGLLRFTFESTGDPSGRGLFEVNLMVNGFGDWGAVGQLYIIGVPNNYYTPGDLSALFKSSFNNIVSEDDHNVIDLTFKAGASGPYDAAISQVMRIFDFGFLLSEISQVDFHWGGLGHALEDWVDEADRSSHADFGDSGDPAKNPASCVESLVRGDAGFVDANINKTKFDAASNDIGTALANFDVRKRVKLKSFLSIFARQFRSVITLATNSQLGMVVINNRYTSADVIISYNDIAGLKFGRTDDDLLTSKVAVEYSYDGSNYLKVTTEAENATTRERYDLDEIATSKTRLADKIDDDDTADAYRDWELAFWQQHHNTVEDMNLDESFMKFEPADIFGIKDLPEDQFPNGENIMEIFERSGQDILPNFMITGFTKSDRVTYEGIQMHDTTPAP